MNLFDLVAQLDAKLQPENFQDYCPNGLQVEGKAKVRKIVTGVTASQQLIDAAIAAKADALLVHHGYFWKGESPVLTGMKGKRIASLMRNNLSLLAYHLPLDAHPELGNNQQLAQLMGWQVSAQMGEFALVGKLEQPLSAAEFAASLEEKLARPPLYLAGHSRPIQTLAWCTGAAQGAIEQAAALGVDAYISGEVSEQTLHQAQELGINYFGAGHHATERYGVKALGEWLAQEFGLECEFIDLPNPV